MACSTVKEVRSVARAGSSVGGSVPKFTLNTGDAEWVADNVFFGIKALWALQPSHPIVISAIKRKEANGWNIRGINEVPKTKRGTAPFYWS